MGLSFHFRFNLRKWWCQCFTAGISQVVVGFRDDDGIVEEVKSYPVDQLPKMGAVSLESMKLLFYWTKRFNGIWLHDNVFIYICINRNGHPQCVSIFWISFYLKSKGSSLMTLHQFLFLNLGRRSIRYKESSKFPLQWRKTRTNIYQALYNAICAMLFCIFDHLDHCSLCYR